MLTLLRLSETGNFLTTGTSEFPLHSKMFKSHRKRTNRVVHRPEIRSASKTDLICGASNRRDDEEEEHGGEDEGGDNDGDDGDDDDDDDEVGCLLMTDQNFTCSLIKETKCWMC